MNETLLSQLTQLNLSPNEAKVYLALLEIGQTSAGEIIKKTGFHRSVVYETLDKLIARKLVFILKKQKIAYFQALDPQKLKDMVKANLELAETLVPALQNLAKAKLPEITIYEGIEEWVRFWLEKTATAKVGSTDCVAGSLSGIWDKFMGPRIVKKYNKLRLERKIKLKMLIFKKDPLELELLKAHPDLHDYRLIQRDSNIEGNFNIWEDSVILNSATEPMIIEVKNPTLVRVFQNIFDILWEVGKPI